MQGSVRLSRILALAAALAWAGAAAWADGPPRRVVSVNLCTDQLAMLLAAPGQLISVSHVARDPVMSAMAQEAQAIPVNHGRPEHVFSMRPDLVLAQEYTDPSAIALMRRLGLQVAQIADVSGLDDVPRALREAGTLMGREARAEELIARYEAGLSALRQPPDSGPLTALYAANGYTAGTSGLTAEILAAAGLRNASQELGYTYAGHLPLELLILAQPQALVTSNTYAGQSRSEEILSHPALSDLAANLPHGHTGPAWVCGTPKVLDAIAEMTALRARP